MLDCVVKRLLAALLVGLSIFPGVSSAADHLGVLGSKPKWSVLENYQGTITHDEFAHLLNDVYCTHGFATGLIKIDNDAAQIVTNRESHDIFTLRFAADANSKERVPRLWRPAKSLSPAKPDKPLTGLRVALEPGHLGAKWAKMEERWFQVGDTNPVTGGDLTLRVSRMLASRLRKLGAAVLYVRNSPQPVTPKRPGDFKELARKILINNGLPQPRPDMLDPSDPEKEKTIRWQSEMLFYRYSEIRRRAVLVNTKLDRKSTRL